jgi:taurine dioxygenase
MSGSAFSVRRLEPVGGEVIGLAPGSESDPGVAAGLRQAWLDHGILLFRDIQDSEQHLALSRCFGDLEIHPFPEIRCKDNPLLVQIGGRNRGPAYVYDGQLKIGRIPWHRDTAYTPDICKGAMLRMLEIPSAEGETLFADTQAAYADLPADMKARLERLEFKATLRISMTSQTRPGAFWKTARQATPAEDPEGGGVSDDDSMAARYPSVIHPAVLAHPETGRKCIFLSPTYVDRFLGLSQAESDELLVQLTAHMLNPRYVYKHSWRINDAILWDNRRMMHAAVGCDLGEPRRALRTTLAGPLRTGRYFDPAATGPDLPAMAD